LLQALEAGGNVVCGLFPREAAEMMVEQIGAYARKHGLGLRCEAAIQKLRP
jgi:ATP-dependent Clp protease adapter protein ClpS